MNFTIDVSLVLQSLAVLGIGWLLKVVNELQRSHSKIKTWMEAHDKQDDERHSEIMKNIDNLWDIRSKL